MSQDNERDLEALESDDAWDFTRGELRKPSRSGRTVVSVSLSRDDFERVTKYASSIGVRTSEFIRRATLERIRPKGRGVTIFGVSGGGGVMIFSTSPLPTTDVWGKVTQEPIDTSPEQKLMPI